MTSPDGAPVHQPASTPDASTDGQAQTPRDVTVTDAPIAWVETGHDGSDAAPSSAAVPGHAPSADPDVVAAVAAPDAGPSFTRTERAPRAPRVPAWQWTALAVLTGALGIQMLIADRARLAQDALWRPVLERACGVLRCALPAWHQPQAYTMLARDVKPAPGAPGVLQVRATFRNDARWPQRWPAVALSLSDADGRVAGARVLVPGDYLDPAQLHATLAPGQSGQMTVQVREPQGGVVAFAFEFR
jgi:hypothetical protein